MSNPFEKFGIPLPAELVASLDASREAAEPGSSFTTPAPRLSGLRTLYVRNGGNDLNSGTESYPLATIKEAVSRLVPDPTGEMQQQVDLTGYTYTSADEEYWALPRAGHRYLGALGDPELSANGKDRVWDFPFVFVADPTHIMDVTVSSIDRDSVTNHQVVNVNETLTPGAHVGQVLFQGVFHQAVVFSNDSSSLTVSVLNVAANFSGTLGLYTQSCVLDVPLRISSSALCIFNGIRFEGSLMRVMGAENTNFNRCYFDNVDFNMFGPGYYEFRDNYHNDGLFRSDGAGFVNYGGVFQDVEFAGHGTGAIGLHEFISIRADGCTAIGRGNAESAFGVVVHYSHITNATTDAIMRQSPNPAGISWCKINDSNGHAINITTGGAMVRLRDVSGTGNSGYGVALANGAQMSDDNVNTVTGTSGDIKLGGSTTTWAAIDAIGAGESLNDSGAAFPEFCRVVKI